VVEIRRQRIKVVERRRKVSWNMIIGKLELYIILSYVMKLLFFGIIGILQAKGVTKLSRRQQNLSLWMQQQTVLLLIPRFSLSFFFFLGHWLSLALYIAL
jgi:hypothetical protein